MTALIFNSGKGSRMGALTQDRPKCLLPLPNGETVLSRQLRFLYESGIRSAVITTGQFHDMITEEANRSALHIVTVNNPRFADTNYIYSMHLAREKIPSGGLLILHGDLVFGEDILPALLSEDGSRVMTDHAAPLPEKDFKVRTENGVVREVSVNIFGRDCCALQPLYKLCDSDAARWFDRVACFVAAGNTAVYAENALNEITREITLRECSYSGKLLCEIDNEADYRAVCSRLEKNLGIC